MVSHVVGLLESGNVYSRRTRSPYFNDSDLDTMDSDTALYDTETTAT